MTDRRQADHHLDREPQDPTLGFARVVRTLAERSELSTLFSGWGPRIGR